MKEIKGNIWDFHEKGCWICVTTNGVVNEDGEAVMGRGIALEAKKRFPGLPHDLGMAITSKGNKLYSWPKCRLVTFPTKHHWMDMSDLCLIEKSCQELVSWVDAVCSFLTSALKIPMVTESAKIYLPRPGCGNGGLYWNDVKPILEKYLDDRFVVVNRKK